MSGELQRASSRSALPTCLGARRDGQPCQSQILLEDGFCPAHSPTRAADMAELGGRGGIASGEARREQGKSVRDRLREKVEENVDAIWDAFENGLTSDDDRTRLAAAVAVLAEAYGKTPQAIVGDVDQPISFRIVSAFSALAKDDPLELTEGSE